MIDELIEGPVWVIRDVNGNPIDDIDTDQIFSETHHAITKFKVMRKKIFQNLPGWEQFPDKAKKGDILIVGKNFGSGSHRQQAVDCFKSLGISLIIAESFGAIYERNAINNAMPILIADDITKKIDDKDEITVDFVSGEITDKTQNKKLKIKPFSKSQLDIYKKGGLLV